MGLGGYPAISLRKARELAGDCRSVLAAGLDPIAARKREARGGCRRGRKGDDIRRLCNRIHQRPRSRVAKSEASPTMEEHARHLREPGGRQAAGVGSGYRARAQGARTCWTRKPETASRVRGRMEAVLDWAKVRRYRTGENPARWRGHLDHLLQGRAPRGATVCPDRRLLGCAAKAGRHLPPVRSNS